MYAFIASEKYFKINTSKEFWWRYLEMPQIASVDNFKFAFTEMKRFRPENA